MSPRSAGRGSTGWRKGSARATGSGFVGESGALASGEARTHEDDRLVVAWAGSARRRFRRRALRGKGSRPPERASRRRASRRPRQEETGNAPGHRPLRGPTGLLPSGAARAWCSRRGWRPSPHIPTYRGNRSPVVLQLRLLPHGPGAAGRFPWESSAWSPESTPWCAQATSAAPVTGPRATRTRGIDLFEEAELAEEYRARDSRRGSLLRRRPRWQSRRLPERRNRQLHHRRSSRRGHGRGPPRLLHRFRDRGIRRIELRPHRGDALRRRPSPVRRDSQGRGGGAPPDRRRLRRALRQLFRRRLVSLRRARPRGRYRDPARRRRRRRDLRRKLEIRQADRVRQLPPDARVPAALRRRAPPRRPSQERFRTAPKSAKLRPPGEHSPSRSTRRVQLRQSDDPRRRLHAGASWRKLRPDEPIELLRRQLRRGRRRDRT